MILRPLTDPVDRPLVAGFFEEAADYIEIERGTPPDAAVTDEFFADAPPGIDPSTSLRLGAADADGRLLGLVEASFGYPDPQDAYLGLLMLAPHARGQGLGRKLLTQVETEARRRGKTTLYLAVLQANRRGLAFWLREGFTLHQAGLSVTLGTRTQPVIRLCKPL